MWQRSDKPASIAQPACNNRSATCADRALLVALHDVTPAHADRLFRAERLLERLGVPAATYLFVPNYHGRWPVEEHADFLAWCRAPRRFAVRWFLHGFFHREDPGRMQAGTLVEWCARTFMTAGEGEFLALRGRALENRTRAGIESFERCFGSRPVGFVAPAWLYNDELPSVLVDAGVAFTESQFHVFDLRSGRAVPAPVVTWTTRTPPRRAASVIVAAAQRRLWQSRPVVRIALHPFDFDRRTIVDSIERTIDAFRVDRRIVEYAEGCDR